MDENEAITLIKSYNIPEINEAMRFITPAIFRKNSYEKEIVKLVEVYHEYLKLTQKNKIINLNKQYWVVEWSWSSMCDGLFVYRETIREHAVINGIDCYFTNDNNRTYLKEDIFESKEDAQKQCDWNESFGYDYERLISRANNITRLITFHNFHWEYKDKYKDD